jgi:hypothetical protein
MIPVETFAKWNPMYAPFMEGKMSHEQVIQVTTACTSMMRQKVWYILLAPALVVVAEIILAIQIGPFFILVSLGGFFLLCCLLTLCSYRIAENSALSAASQFLTSQVNPQSPGLRWSAERISGFASLVCRPVDPTTNAVIPIPATLAAPSRISVDPVTKQTILTPMTGGAATMMMGAMMAQQNVMMQQQMMAQQNMMMQNGMQPQMGMQGMMQAQAMAGAGIVMQQGVVPLSTPNALAVPAAAADPPAVGSFCSGCGTRLAAGAAFCSGCGAATGQQQKAPLNV